MTSKPANHSRSGSLPSESQPTRVSEWRARRDAEIERGAARARIRNLDMRTRYGTKPQQPTASEERERKRLAYRAGRGHPNFGKTSPHRIGQWLWEEEVGVSPEERDLPKYPARKHSSARITGKRSWRWVVFESEKSRAYDAAKLCGYDIDSGYSIIWDERDWLEIEEEVNRRWINAQQRIRRREKRRAAEVVGA